MTVADLSGADARRLSLRAQGVLGAPDRRAGVDGLLRRLGAVQLDTISVLARSHELVPYARLGPVGRPAVEGAYWGTPARAFEYYSHAACVLPLESWPWFAFRRRHWRDRVALDPAMEGVCQRLADEGPLTATDLGGARRDQAGWWNWSDAKRAVELLWRRGEVVCVERRGWKRVYALAEGLIPPDDRSDDECHVWAVAEAGRVLGVATRNDLADVHRLYKRSVTDAVIEAAGLVPVTVAGWGEPAWADPAALAAGPPRGRHRTALLSPFDSLVWDRARTERIFGFAFQLEAYVPRAKRVHGYFAMPLLAGGRIVGRVDPAREGRTLVARQATLDGPAAVEPMHQALAEAAEWVGCDSVVVEHLTVLA